MSAAIVAVYAWFVPLGIDGGWYSYPGYALSMGRDPSENLSSLAAVREIPDSVRALFNYELRSFLIVPIYAAWFKVAGTSMVSLKIFGMLQWLLAGALVVAAVHAATGKRIIAYVAGLAAISDTWLISQSMSDLRPDVPNAIGAIACACALLQFERTRRARWLVLATGATFALALLHLTSVLALTFISMLALVLASSPRQGSTRRIEFLIIPLVAGIAFVWRQPIMDIMVPTQFIAAQEAPYRDDLWAAFLGIVRNGIAAKVAFELDRWTDYFLIANVAQLLFIGVGATGLVAAWRNRTDHLPLAFLVAAAVTVPVAIIIDPTQTRGHLLPLACLAYVGAGLGLAAALDSPRATRTVRAVAAIGVLAVALRFAFAADLIYQHSSAGVSNKNVVRFMTDVLEPNSHHMIIAPTYLWPYVRTTGSVVLIEPGSRLWPAEDERWEFVSKVIVDRDFDQRGWKKFSTRMEQCQSFVKERAVGSPDSNGFFLEAYRVVARPCGHATD